MLVQAAIGRLQVPSEAWLCGYVCSQVASIAASVAGNGRTAVYLDASYSTSAFPQRSGTDKRMLIIPKAEIRVAKEIGRKSKKSSKATGKRRDKASPSSTFKIGGTSRAYEAAGAAAASMVTSLLNSFVRDVISAGLTSAAALLTTMGQHDKDTGGESARPVTRARSVKSIAPGSRRKPAASSGATATEEPACPKTSRRDAAKASSSATKRKRSDDGVKRVQRRKSGSAASPAAPSTLAEANQAVPAAVLSAAKPKERAAPKAGRKKSAPSPAVRTRSKRSYAGVKQAPAQKNERAERLVQPAALKEPNTPAPVAAPRGAQPKRRAARKAAPGQSAPSAGTRTRKKRSVAAVEAVPAARTKRAQGPKTVAPVGSGNVDPQALPSNQPDAPLSGSGSEASS